MTEQPIDEAAIRARTLDAQRRASTYDRISPGTLERTADDCMALLKENERLREAVAEQAEVHHGWANLVRSAYARIVPGGVTAYIPLMLHEMEEQAEQLRNFCPARVPAPGTHKDEQMNNRERDAQVEASIMGRTVAGRWWHTWGLTRLRTADDEAVHISVSEEDFERDDVALNRAAFTLEPSWFGVVGDIGKPCWHKVPHYTTDYNACAAMRARLKEIHKEGEFARILRESLAEELALASLDYTNAISGTPDVSVIYDSYATFALIDATPLQQVDAALKAVGVEVEA